MSQEDEAKWAALMVKAQSGDKPAYRKLLSLIHPYIFNILYPKISNKDAIEDIAQEVLISVHTSMRTYDGQRPFKPWLHSIIHYRSIDYLRKHYKTRVSSFEDIDSAHFEPELVTNPDHIGEYKDIEKALKSLPKKQRDLFNMMKIQGYTAQEISDQTGMTISAVKVSVHRTQNKLKELLK